MTLRSFLNTLLTVTLSFLAGVFTALSVAPDLLRNLLDDDPPSALTARLLASGELAGTGSTRRAEGRAQLLQGDGVVVLRLTEFEVTHGPDLHVWLLDRAGMSVTDEIRAAEVTDLGPLGRPQGDQVFVVPDGTEVGEVEAVAIWSASARTLYAVADFVGAEIGGTGEVSDG